VGTARAIAHAYSVFATGGKELGLREETLRQLMAPPVPPTHGFHDEVMKVDIRSHSVSQSPAERPLRSSGLLWNAGSGGSFGFADPEARIGYGYVPNRMNRYLTDPRDLALRTAMYHSMARQIRYHE